MENERFYLSSVLQLATFVCSVMILSSRGLVQLTKQQLPGLFLCPLMDVFIGGLSHGWLHRMPLVLCCITFLQMILNHSAAWPIFKVQVVRVWQRQFAVEKEEHVFVFNSYGIYLSSWCPPRFSSFISSPLKAVPDATSSAALREEEIGVFPQQKQRIPGAFGVHVQPKLQHKIFRSF